MLGDTTLPSVAGLDLQELEVLEVLGKRQLGVGELVLDRAGLLFVHLGVEQIADNGLGFVLARDGKVVKVLSSTADHLTPDQHVKHSLAIVEQLQAGKAP